MMALYANPDCCRRCLAESGEGARVGPLWIPASASRMVVCRWCGHKLCPSATDHLNDCTGSNDPGQLASEYA